MIWRIIIVVLSFASSAVPFAYATIFINPWFILAFLFSALFHYLLIRNKMDYPLRYLYFRISILVNGIALIIMICFMPPARLIHYIPNSHLGIALFVSYALLQVCYAFGSSFRCPNCKKNVIINEPTWLIWIDPIVAHPDCSYVNEKCPYCNHSLH